LSSRGFLLVITAPSGTGKTTIYKKVLARNTDLAFSVSYSTRRKREDETQGVDYFFVDKKTFQQMREDGAFLEWANVHGDLYGTEKKQIEKFLKEGRVCILDLDVQGALNVMKLFPDAVTVFIKPPNLNELDRRLQKRGTEKEKEVKRRLLNAQKELEYMSFFQYIIVNDTVENSVKELEEIIVNEINRRG
jgi:guanylate kinase